MTNATKYTRDYVHLSCRLAEDGEHFIISVEDNGMGISPDEQQKILPPSIRLTTTSREPVSDSTS